MVDSGKVGELSRSIITGWSAGFCLRTCGGCGMSRGRPPVEDTAACTSCAAKSMSRSRLKVMLILVRPWELREFIDSMSGIVAKRFSNCVATVDAMVCALAPGTLALTFTVG